ENKLFLRPFSEPRFPEENPELFTGIGAQLHPRFISQVRRGRGFCVTPNGKAQCPTARRNKLKPKQHYYHDSKSHTKKRRGFRLGLHAMRGRGDGSLGGTRPENQRRDGSLDGSL